MGKKVKVSVVGASGYTGTELLRLVLRHPSMELVGVFGNTTAGKPLSALFPGFSLKSLGTVGLGTVGLGTSGLGTSEQSGVVDRAKLPAALGQGVAKGDAKAGRGLVVEPTDIASIASRSDAVFCALPHGASQTIVAGLVERGVLVLDLSADYRLRSEKLYTEWYGAHAFPALLGMATYGLVEVHKEALKTAKLIAVPGCYPTATILSFAPLLKAKLVTPASIIVDAKSGASGAGKALSDSTHFSALHDGIRPYKVGGQHRHLAEIEEQLCLCAGEEVRVTFTPHLCPFSRGILAVGYATPVPSATEQGGMDAFLGRCVSSAQAMYEDSGVVEVLPPGTHLDTAWVRGSARALVSYQVDKRTGRLISQCVIDNLAKGAAAQAVQAFNVRHGLAEAVGLPMDALMP